jgi:hypothetical protein
LGNTNHHAVEEALWANFVAPHKATSTYATGAWPMGVSGTSSLIVDFLDSNSSTLGVFDLFFELGGCAPSGDSLWYKLEGAVINSASINFEIDGIATIEWSGFANQVQEYDGTAPVVTIGEALTSTSNFIRNRLTTLGVSGFGNSVTALNKAYSVVLTGGSISFENNISFLTPENLCMVNVPIGHVAGNRTISGNFTAYLNTDTASTADLFEDLQSAKTQVTNQFELNFGIGGADAPKIQVKLPQCHLEIPTHSIEDVIALDINFHALPTSMGTADEAVITYTGIAYS